MTVTDTTDRKIATGDGVTVLITFTFKYFNASEISVYVAGVLISSSLYSLTPNPTGEGGSIIFNSAPANAASILILRDITFDQTTEIPVVGDLSRGTLENALDKLTLAVQQLSGITDRAIRLSDTFTGTVNLQLPNPSAGKAIVWNGTADALTNSTVDPNAFATSETNAVASAAAALASQIAAAASAVSAAASAGTFTPATVADILTGTDVAKQGTAASIAGLWKQGSDIASATALLIPATGGGYFNVTGTVTITSVSQAAALKTGRTIRLLFQGALTLTHDATALILPGSANITTVAGDSAILVCEDATNNYWRCVHYSRGDGTALGASLIRLSKQTVSNVASVVFTTGIDALHAHYVLKGRGVYGATDDKVCILRASTNAGSSYDGGSSYAWNGTLAANASHGGELGSESDTAIVLAGNGGAAGYGMSNTVAKRSNFVVDFFDPSVAGENHEFQVVSSGQCSNASRFSYQGMGEYIANTTAINALKILMSSGNIYGVFELWAWML